jgi:hypothetical protein
MSKAEEAFSRAAMCADQAQAAQDEEWRTFFKRLRMMSGLEAAEAPPER